MGFSTKINALIGWSIETLCVVFVFVFNFLFGFVCYSESAIKNNTIINAIGLQIIDDLEWWRSVADKLRLSHRPHTHSRTISRCLWCVRCVWQKPNNNDECALFKANDAEALTSGSTFIEIGEWLCSKSFWQCYKAGTSNSSTTLWEFIFMIFMTARHS